MTEDDVRALEQTPFDLAPTIDTHPGRIVSDLPDRVHGVYGAAPLNLDSEDAALVLMKSAGVLIDAAVRSRDVACLWLADAWLSDVLDSYQLDEMPDAVSEAMYFRGNARIAIADQHTEDRMTAVPREQVPGAACPRPVGDAERCSGRDVSTSHGARN